MFYSNDEVMAEVYEYVDSRRLSELKALRDDLSSKLKAAEEEYDLFLRNPPMPAYVIDNDEELVTVEYADAECAYRSAIYELENQLARIERELNL